MQLILFNQIFYKFVIHVTWERFFPISYYIIKLSVIL